MAVRDPYYARAAARTVLCDARIDWVVTGDVSRDVAAVATTWCHTCQENKSADHIKIQEAEGSFSFRLITI